MKWQEVPLKHLAAVPITNGVGEAAEHEDRSWPRYVRTTDIAGPRSLRDETFKSLPPEIASRATLLRGDIVMTAAGGVGKSMLYTSSAPACYAGYLVRFRPREGVDGRFVAYWMESRPYWEQIDGGKVVSTIDNFSAGKYQNLRCPLPGERQQGLIADFLDAETARIDALIAKKQQMIEAVTERHESMIFSAITRGLRGERAMKRTSLAWISEIPKGWGTPTVSTNFDLQLGKMLSAEAANGPEKYPYLRNVNVQWDRIDTSDLATMHFSHTDRQRCELRRGDVLICEGGEVGRAAVWENEVEDCFFQKAIHRARPRYGEDGRYLMYCLRAAAKMSVFAVEGNLSTIVHLTGEQLAAHRFPWPDDRERREIVSRLDLMSRSKSEICVRLRRQIELLREHRQALITAAVSGELEIPGLAA